jgi:hypothetical protein
VQLFQGSRQAVLNASSTVLSKSRNIMRTKSNLDYQAHEVVIDRQKAAGFRTSTILLVSRAIFCSPQRRTLRRQMRLKAEAFVPCDPAMVISAVDTSRMT